MRRKPVHDVANENLPLHDMREQRLVVEILQRRHHDIGIFPGVDVDCVGEPRVVADVLHDRVPTAAESRDGVKVNLGGDHGEVDPADEVGKLDLVVNLGDGEDDDLAGDGFNLALAEPRGAVGFSQRGAGGEEDVGGAVKVAGHLAARVRTRPNVEVHLERAAQLVDFGVGVDRVGDDDAADDDKVRVYVGDVVVDDARRARTGDDTGERGEELLADVLSLDVHGHLDGDPDVAALAAGVVVDGLALADGGDGVLFVLLVNLAAEPGHGQRGGGGVIVAPPVLVGVVGSGGVQLRRKHGGLDETLPAARALDVSARGGPREDIPHGGGGPVDVIDDELDASVVPEEGELPGLGARDGNRGWELGVVVELAVHRVRGVVHLLHESQKLVLVVDAKDGERKLDTLEGARRVVKVGQVGLGATLADAAGTRGVDGADKVLVDVDVLEVLKILPRAAADDAVHLVAVDV